MTESLFHELAELFTDLLCLVLLLSADAAGFLHVLELRDDLVDVAAHARTSLGYIGAQAHFELDRPGRRRVGVAGEFTEPLAFQ